MLDICGVGKRMPTRRRLHLSQGFFNLTSLASGSCLYQVVVVVGRWRVAHTKGLGMESCSLARAFEGELLTKKGL